MRVTNKLFYGDNLDFCVFKLDAKQMRDLRHLSEMDQIS